MVIKWERQAGASLGKEENAIRWEIGSGGGVPVYHAVTSTTLWEVLKLGIVMPLTFLPFKEYFGSL